MQLKPATERVPTPPEVTITIEGDDRVIRSNGIPDHAVGRFPGRGNPNRITAQSHQYRVPANPTVAPRTTPIRGEFGVAINGVPFDPGAAEFFRGSPGWQYEPLSAAINLGIDASHAHVQPTGKYHYHGLPTGLLDNVKLSPDQHSPIVAWAADGFPVYAMHGYRDGSDANSGIAELKSSYRLKPGNRPGETDPASGAPGGRHDGTFVADYQYVAGSGDLDQCNGRQCVTPDFPNGTYAYFLTTDWPVIPRRLRGTPSADFMRRGGPIGPDRRGGPGEPGRPDGRDSSRRPDEFGPPPRPGQILPSSLSDALDLTRQQRRQIDDLQNEVDRRLEAILTSDQLQQLQRPPSGPPQ